MKYSLQNLSYSLEDLLKKIYTIYDNNNIIIANGEFPMQNYLLKLINAKKLLICCDGAVNKLQNNPDTLNAIPDYIIGDLDSITPKNQQKFANKSKIIHIQEQDTNDLTKAVSIAKKLGIDECLIFGATGLREDHAFSNIYLLSQYNKLFSKIAMISDYGIFTAYNINKNIQTISCDTIIGQQISLFSNTQLILSCKQLKWQLNNYRLHNISCATLNQAIDTQLEILVNNEAKNLDENSDSYLIIYRAFEIKK